MQPIYKSNPHEDYELLQKIGSGTYGSVRCFGPAADCSINSKTLNSHKEFLQKN
jgi:hypothetical protein